MMSCSSFIITDHSSRLLDLAPSYYDMKDFPAGETKNALMRVFNKRYGRQMESNAGDDGHKKKKRKREHAAAQAAYTQAPVEKKEPTPAQAAYTQAPVQRK
jgi:hypothetical protein